MISSLSDFSLVIGCHYGEREHGTQVVAMRIVAHIASLVPLLAVASIVVTLWSSGGAGQKRTANAVLRGRVECGELHAASSARICSTDTPGFS
jgi:hypothetical protein